MKKNWKFCTCGVAAAAILSMAACSAYDETEGFSFAEEETETDNFSLAEDETQDLKGVNTSLAEEEVQDAGTENPSSTGEKTQDTNMQEVENTGLEATAEELLDLFINGSINAVDSTDLISTFNITDLNMDSEEGDAYSIGEKIDLDNDGENELIISGPYGGIYLDARDNKVYEFAAADGTALILSYTYYNGAVWIMYSNRSSAGFEFYHMEKFEGADNLVAEMNFGEEFDINNAEAGLKYTLNGTEISYDEYTELCSKIFAAQVNTYFN